MALQAGSYFWKTLLKLTPAYQLPEKLIHYYYEKKLNTNTSFDTAQTHPVLHIDFVNLL